MMEENQAMMASAMKLNREASRGRIALFGRLNSPASSFELGACSQHQQVFVVSVYNLSPTLPHDSELRLSPVETLCIKSS